MNQGESQIKTLIPPLRRGARGVIFLLLQEVYSRCRGEFNETSPLPRDNWVKPAPTSSPLICNNEANALDITSTLKIDAEFPTLLLLLQPAEHCS